MRKTISFRRKRMRDLQREEIRNSWKDSAHGNEKANKADIIENEDRVMLEVTKEVKRDCMPMWMVSETQLDQLNLSYASVPSLAGFWEGTKASLLIPGSLSRSEKEILGAFICRTRDSFCIKKDRRCQEILQAGPGVQGARKHLTSRLGDPTLIRDIELCYVAHWIRDSQTKDGYALSKVPPFPQETAPEILALSFFYNYTNRMQAALKWTVEEKGPSFSGVLGLVTNTVGSIQRFWSKIGGKTDEYAALKSCLSRDITKLIKAAKVSRLPEDFMWTDADPEINQAYAYWYSTVQGIADQYVPIRLQKFFVRTLKDDFNGHEEVFSEKWLKSITEQYQGLEEEATTAHRCALDFMLRVAFNVETVDKCVMSNLAEYFPLLHVRKGLCMWAAFQTSRQIAGWQSESINSFPDLLR